MGSPDGETSISDGFALARELFADDGEGSRTNAAKVVLFVSDGEQTVDAADDKTLFQTAVDAAQLVKDLPATVFAWGVGDDVSFATLQAIATSPSDANAVTAVFSKDVAGLVDYLGQLEAAVCNESPPASPPPSPSPPPPSPSPPPPSPPPPSPSPPPPSPSPPPPSASASSPSPPPPGPSPPPP